MENLTRKFMTIREVAKIGILPEHALRLMQKQGRVPGIYSGRRYLVNYPLLLEQLDKQSVECTGGRADDSSANQP